MKQNVIETLHGSACNGTLGTARIDQSMAKVWNGSWHSAHLDGGPDRTVVTTLVWYRMIGTCKPYAVKDGPEKEGKNRHNRYAVQYRC